MPFIFNTDFPLPKIFVSSATASAGILSSASHFTDLISSLEIVPLFTTILPFSIALEILILYCILGSSVGSGVGFGVAVPAGGGVGTSP